MRIGRMISDILKKPGATIFARLSLHLGIVVFILSLISVLAFYVNQGLVHEYSVAMFIAGNSFILSFGLRCLVLIFIVVSLVLVLFTKPRIKNIKYALAGFSLALLSMPSVDVFETVRSSISGGRSRDVRQIAETIKEYSKDHDGQLPPFNNWCNALTDFNPKISSCLGSDGAGLDVSGLPGKFSCFALNENLTGIPLRQIPKNVVLLFETAPAANPVGGCSSIRDYEDEFNGKGCVILFGDLHLEFVKTRHFGGLKWGP